MRRTAILFAHHVFAVVVFPIRLASLQAATVSVCRGNRKHAPTTFNEQRRCLRTSAGCIHNNNEQLRKHQDDMPLFSPCTYDESQKGYISFMQISVCVSIQLNTAARAERSACSAATKQKHRKLQIECGVRERIERRERCTRATTIGNLVRADSQRIGEQQLGNAVRCDCREFLFLSTNRHASHSENACECCTLADLPTSAREEILIRPVSWASVNALQFTYV